MLAAQNGHAEIVSILLQKGADTNVVAKVSFYICGLYVNYFVKIAYKFVSIRL